MNPWTGSSRRHFFNQQAATWDDHPKIAEQQARLRELLAGVPVRRGASALDLGCGTGIAIPALAAAVGRIGRVIGLDESSAMIFKACKIHPGVVVGDALELPFTGTIFDFVLAFAVLPHLDDPIRFLVESSRVLRPAGRILVLHFMSRAQCNDFHRHAGSAVEHDILPAPSQLNQWARIAGLEPIQFRESDDLFLWLAAKSA